MHFLFKSAINVVKASGLISTSVLLILITNLHSVYGLRKAWRRVEAINGFTAVLPCDIGNMNESSDLIYVVLWYLNGRKEPIYSFDNRPRALKTSNKNDTRHIIQSNQLKDRVHFSISGSIPSLHIQPVRKEDGANYTCRVDFRVESSRTTHLHLHVVVPPNTPILRMDGGRIHETLKHPLIEGQAVRMACIVKGGEPPPAIIWLKNGREIDSRTELQNDYQSVNYLMIPRLSRTFHEAKLSCIAYNNNVTSPTSSSVNIKMHLRPLKVRLISPFKKMRVGQYYDFKCIISGSKPKPNITWTLGNSAYMRNISSTEENKINSTVSITRIQANRTFHGQKLICSAVNKLFPSHVLSDTIILNITYIPVATLELGRGVPTNVKENDDVYFNCVVDSNPPTYQTRWFHENDLLPNAPNKNIIISGHSLALRHIVRQQAGRYACAAYNSEGEGKSSPIYLKVDYAPVCSLSEPHSKVMAAAIDHILLIPCDVLASPKEVKYSWVFNNSFTTERINGDRFHLSEGKSFVKFVARKQQDYGTFQCWAENIVGRTKHPCYYHVLPAGTPDPPVNCSVTNKTYDSLIIACQAGFDGGLKQEFIARVFEAVTGRSKQNETSDIPYFILKRLTPGIDYIIAVTSRNSLGESISQRLEAFTYKMAENRMRNGRIDENDLKRDDAGLLFMGESDASQNITLTLLGAVLVVLCAIALFVFLLKGIMLRRNSTSGQQSDQNLTDISNPTHDCPLQLRTRLNDDKKTSFEVKTFAIKSSGETFTVFG